MLWPNCPTCPAQIAPFTARTLAPRPHRPGCPRPPARAALAGRKPVVRPWIWWHLSSGDGVFAGSGTRRRAVVPAVRVHAGRRERLPSQRPVPVARRRAVGAAAAAPSQEPTTAPASLASKRKFWELDGAEAAPTRQALRLQWVCRRRRKAPAAGAGRAGWRLALESFEVVGLPPGSRWPRRRRRRRAPILWRRRCASSPPPCSHARACASPCRCRGRPPKTRRRRRRPPCRSCSPPRRGCSRSRS